MQVSSCGVDGSDLSVCWRLDKDNLVVLGGTKYHAMRRETNQLARLQVGQNQDALSDEIFDIVVGS